MDKVLDFTASVKNNNNTLSIDSPIIHSINGGMIIEGVIQIKIYDFLYNMPFSLGFVDGTRCGNILFALLSLTDIKDGGYGFPSEIQVVFDDKGEACDIIGDATKV